MKNDNQPDCHSTQLSWKTARLVLKDQEVKIQRAARICHLTTMPSLKWVQSGQKPNVKSNHN